MKKDPLNINEQMTEANTLFKRSRTINACVFLGR